MSTPTAVMTEETCDTIIHTPSIDNVKCEKVKHITLNKISKMFEHARYVEKHTGNGGINNMKFSSKEKNIK